MFQWRIRWCRCIFCHLRLSNYPLALRRTLLYGPNQILEFLRTASPTTFSRTGCGVPGNTFAGFFFLLPFGEQQELAWSAIATSFFSSNLYFWSLSGYFDGPADFKPLLNMWSLSVEEQFYWVWPLLLLGFWSHFRNHGHRYTLIIVLSFIAVVSFGLSVGLTKHSQPTAFFMMPVRAWEFAMGGIVALLPIQQLSENQSARSFLISSLGILGLAMIAWAVTGLSRATEFPGSIAIVPVLGTALIIYSGNYNKGLAFRLLTQRFFVVIGLLSYSWYLWHWPLMATARAYAFGKHDLLRDSLLSLTALGLALLTYRFVENPIRYARSGLFATTRKALMSGLSLLVIVAMCSIGLGVWSKFETRSTGLGAKLLAAMRDREIVTTPECDKEFQMEVFTGALFAVEKCSFGGTPLRVLVWGDSFAEHYFPLLNYLGKKHSLGLVGRLFGGCPPALGIIPLRGGIPRRDCAPFNELVKNELFDLQQRGIDSVILSANWLMQDDPQPGYDGAEVDANVSARFSEGLTRTLDLLESHHLKVLLIAPSPEFPIAVPLCLGRKPADACGISRFEFEAQRRKALGVIIQAASMRTNVRIFDPVNSLCNSTYCPAIINNVIAYRDNGHIAASASSMLEMDLDPYIHWLADDKQSNDGKAN